MILTLLPHPAAPAVARAVEVALRTGADGGLVLDYRIAADRTRLRVPVPTAPVRADGLWRTTCAELFLAASAGTAYREFNFSPAGAWAVYDFSAPRQRTADPVILRPPQMAVCPTPDHLTVSVRLDPALLPAGGWRAGVTAVIEGADGCLGYWALAHPAAQPDFHHPGGFRLAGPLDSPDCRE